jgi:MFS family permease
VTGVLTSTATLGMTSTEVGLIASIYLAGEMVGALVFGRMSDMLGRQRLLIMTLLLYLLGTGAAAFTTGHHTGWLVFFTPGGSSPAWASAGSIRDPRRGDRGVLRHRADLRSARSRVLRRLDRGRIQSHRAGLGLWVGGLIMMLGGVIELIFGINAEGKSLETVTKPLTATSDDQLGQDKALDVSRG